ncbi:MAG: hypothetical protein A3H94_00570 [Acidobacteria bacterium RIFCSPLOWO2_02_FULL_60_20]|nr:MAG: hypothetical protein A3H94_00570 [Acidobacteria bacterium RIFCSPLOWO2_02_FULL_60_20]
MRTGAETEPGAQAGTALPGRNPGLSLFGFPEQLEGLGKLLPYGLLLSITLALYGPTLFFDFVSDDRRYVLENLQIRRLTWDHFREMWTSSYFSNYAPLHNLIMAVAYAAGGGLDPFAFHLTQLVLHAACVAALYFLLSAIESKQVALLATVLFAVYPPNLETVAWVAEIKSTLAFLFFLVSFWFYARMGRSERPRNGAWCALFLILSLLSKINTVVAPGIFLLYDYKQGYAVKKGRVWSLSCLFLISALFAWVHMISARPMSLGAPGMLLEESIVDFAVSPSSLASGYFGGLNVHLLNLPGLLLFYVRMVVFPYPLSIWHMVRIYGALNWQSGLAWIAVLVWLWILYRSSREYQFWQLWFIVFLLPVLQIVPNSIWVADRYLYIPAIGAFVLLGKLLFNFLDRHGDRRLRWSAELACLGIILSFAWSTHQHLPVWRSGLSLWQDTIKGCMTSPYCHRGLGEAYVAIGYRYHAIEELFRAVQLRPASTYLISLGDAYTDVGDYKRALVAYRLAQQTGELVPINILAKVARAHYGLGELQPARAAVNRGLELNPNNPRVLTVKAFIDWKMGDREQARATLRKVLELNAEDSLSAHPRDFFTFVWGNQAEVSAILSDLGPF